MFKFYFALWTSKFFSLIFRILAKVSSRKGTNLPGQIAIRLCPDFLGKIGKPEKIIAVKSAKYSQSFVLNDLTFKLVPHPSNSRNAAAFFAELAPQQLDLPVNGAVVAVIVVAPHLV